MSDNATNMRKLMESINPTEAMDVADIPVDSMGAMDNNGEMGEYGAEMGGEEVGASTDIIDALEGEFKRLTTEYLQTGGELDEAGLEDIREKLGKHMTSILDVLHSGWMDNMMDQGANESTDSEAGPDSPETESSKDDHEGETDEEHAEHEAEESDEEEKDEDDDSESDDEDDKDDDEEEFNFDEAHLNEGAAVAFRKLQDRMLKG